MNTAFKNTIGFSLPIIFFLSIFFTFYFSWRGIDEKGYERVISGDGIGYYMYLPNIFLYKTIQNQTPDNQYIFEHHGRGVNKYYSGTALAMLPFYTLGYVLAYQQGEEHDAYSPPFQKAISLGAIFYCLVGFYFLRLFLKLYNFNIQLIDEILLILFLGTHLFTYTLFWSSMSHVYSWCFINIFLYLVKRFFISKNEIHLTFAVLVFSIIVLIRPLNAIILLLVPFLSASFLNFKNGLYGFFNVKNILKYSLLFFSVFSIQMILWYLQSGTLFIWSYKDEGFYFSSPKILDVLFSFRKGFFVYTPACFFALFGFFYLRKKNIFELYNLVGFIVVLIYFISSWWNWYYGPSFSQRPFVEFLGVFGYLLIILFDSLKNTRVKFIVKIAITGLIFINLIQNYQLHTNIISTWDMNFEKYKYVFLKIDPKYRNSLGGNNDIYPYKAKKEKIFEIHEDFKKDSLRYCDYSLQEFKWSLLINLDTAFLGLRGLHAELNLNRLEKDVSNAYFVMELLDSIGNQYHYYSFKINEIPLNKLNVWKKVHYSVGIPQIHSSKDHMKLYIWNPERKSFLLDEFHLEIYKN